MVIVYELVLKWHLRCPLEWFRTSPWMNWNALDFFPPMEFCLWHFGYVKFSTASTVKLWTLWYIFCSHLCQVWSIPWFINFAFFFILEKHGPLTFSIPDIRRRSIHDIFSAIFLFICQVDTGKKYSGRFEIVLDLLCDC